MPEEEGQSFSGLRAALWPIHRHELRKLLPVLAMAFLISFAYNILRPLKDTVVVKAPGSSAEVIPFIKVWVMFPSAVAITALFTWFSRHMCRERVFYAMMSCFLAYYALFVLVLMPHADKIHAHRLADWLTLHLPVGAAGLISMIRYWSFAAFYAMCELWGSAIFFLLFWSFVNEITRIDEAKRFYPLLGAGAHASGIFSGYLGAELALVKYIPQLPIGSNDWEQSIFLLLLCVLVAGLLCMGIFRWMHLKVLSDGRYYDPSKAQARTKKRLKVSFSDSVRYLAKSPYMRNVAIIVLTYNVVINLSEVIWKDRVSALYDGEGEFHAYMCWVTSMIGWFATGAAFLFVGSLIRRLGWTVTAMVTPAILLITTLLFFGALIFPDMIADFAWLLPGSELLHTIVIFGTTQNVLSRGAKYTVYDGTKEMAFIPLSDESKLKGKTTIDGVGTRLGKSGGSVVYQALFLLCGGLGPSIPFVAATMLVLIGVWMLAVRKLGIGFEALSEEGCSEEEANEAIRGHELREQTRLA